jgi:hypothetical protein
LLKKERGCMRQQRDTLMVPVSLTEDELLVYGMQLAAERPKEELLDNELKQFADQVKANKTKIRARIADLSNRINQKKEMRQVECTVRYDFTRKEKSWINPTTGEILKREPISQAELQEEMELENPEQGGAA